MTSPSAQYTDFSKDVLGRYICNGLDEAMASTSGPGARPFDIVVIGGGSFGSTTAQHVLYADKFRNHRILVLEAGPFLLAEHVQNLPTLGLTAPGPISADPGIPRSEVWGLPWRTDVEMGFPGLAYCVGGRSVFWGGWSPRLLDTATDTEMPRDRWPFPVADDLNERFFGEAAEQIGTDQTNDFVFGAMHRALRKQLATGIGGVGDAIPLAELPDPPWVDPTMPAGRRNLLKLEAPLAVQGRAPRSGFFPINKFSGVPLLMRAARQAYFESAGNDQMKRLMVVPNCHVKRLITSIHQEAGQVVAIETNLGSIPVPDRGVVVLAGGTIENARLALLSFGGTLGYDLIGTNLIGHVRSNYTVRIPRTSLAGVVPSGDLEASALFVKGRKDHADGSVSHFHLQITAAGLKGLGTNSEAELFQKIPDIDLVDSFRSADEDNVVMTIRGVGELQPGNPEAQVTLSAEADEFGVPRAFVAMGDPRSPGIPGESQQTTNDRELWGAMDAASDQVLTAFVGANPVTTVSRNRDGLGTTHHESGTLRMGLDPAASVTTPNARFHHVVNAYAIGPALLPTMGSPNPMLSGVALSRRLAEHLVAASQPPVLEAGFDWLFDGSAALFARWVQAGPGSFELNSTEEVLVAHPAGDIGLLFYAAEAFGDFTLRLQFRLDSRVDNSGVFVRARDPREPSPDITDPRILTDTAWIAVHTGFEMQIDDQAAPDQADIHRTGAVYDIPLGTSPGQQSYARGSALQPGEWNDYEIGATGNAYSVSLNGFRTSTFTNSDLARGLAPSADSRSGYIGLQCHTGSVAFRAIRIRR